LRTSWHAARAACAALAVTVATAADAHAASPLGLSACADTQGVHQCSGLVRTWDGVPLDTTVTLPAGAAARLPLVVEIHGFGNSKYEYLDPESTAYTDNAYAWARAGYAVLTYTARGLWGSCGTPESRAANPDACARGYIHLADHRYEVRDTQELVGRLVDEGVADAQRIGVTGDSYGGGQSFALAALRDRVMLPDGQLVPWRSPAGTPLSIAAAAPVIPWTDLMGAIAPNGRTTTDAIAPTDATSTPVGVFKISFAHGILAAAQFATGPGQPTGEPFVPGRPMGYLAPAGTDPEADVPGWVARADEGEPYTDERARQIVTLLGHYHSAYQIDPSRPPPPLLVASGFTDDLFPVDEAVRFANRTRRDHPGTPVALLLGDFGHQRASNKQAVRTRLVERIHGWFDEHLRGGPRAPRGVEATTQTCPRDAPADGPFSAPSFAALARVRLHYAFTDPQTIDSSAGDPAVASAIDPVAGGGDACATTPSATQRGTATYRLPAATGAGYTLLGSPAITARLGVTGDPDGQQIAGRLWDVAPDGGPQTLVARGFYRPRGGGDQAWQLAANGWRFAAGHVAKLELLGADAPYGRASNDSFRTVVERLEFALPVREAIKRRMRLTLVCTANGTLATATVPGAQVRRVDFLAPGRRPLRDRAAPFRRIVARRRSSQRRRLRVTARAALTGEPSVRATRSIRACG
jgi:predicted acyl esterase